MLRLFVESVIRLHPEPHGCLSVPSTPVTTMILTLKFPSTWVALITATVVSFGVGMMSTRNKNNHRIVVKRIVDWFRRPFPLLDAEEEDGMPKLPKDVVQYSQVPKNTKQFTYHTIPKGLLQQHNTKKGTWGVIRVTQGKLEYQINEPSEKQFELTPDRPGVIPPTILHQVKPLTEDIEFVVEFYRLPKTGPFDKRQA